MKFKQKGVKYLILKRENTLFGSGDNRRLY